MKTKLTGIACIILAAVAMTATLAQRRARRARR